MQQGDICDQTQALWQCQTTAQAEGKEQYRGLLTGEEIVIHARIGTTWE